MDHRPAAVDPPREEGRVLVLRRHRRAEPLDRPEVLGRCERHERAAPAVGGVGDDPLVALFEPRQAGILAAPELLRVALGIGAQQRLGIEPPAVDAVLAPGDLEVGDAAQVLDPQQQDRLVIEEGCARIEDGIGGIRQVGRRDDRIVLIALEQWLGGRAQVERHAPRVLPRRSPSSPAPAPAAGQSRPPRHHRREELPRPGRPGPRRGACRRPARCPSRSPAPGRPAPGRTA